MEKRIGTFFFKHNYTAESDARLVELITTGNQKAFEELIHRYQRAVINFAFRFIGSREDAKDIAQETFIRFFQAANRYEPSAQFKTYLFRITTNLCIDFKEKKKPEYMDELPETYSSSTPFKELHQKEISETISKAVHSLPENQRVALLLHHFEGMKYAEIAGVMNTSVSAVESLLVRAKKTLREKLKLFQ
ncbi:MAG TPA: hypothetical protein DHV28_09335 [Ignavibacteriales bacterium]|nr:MAG: hypothetical protein A2057_01660 [Ignavibacteria bacterium GWA2_35_9]OGU36581.1 MAG: hypothetical protein A2068_09845 [Ignavibacteria bacterium GWB2_35_6b]OGU52598.1 MAG: hypothetical protein A2080_04830 [Ignavibacteria bacterium GWC2_36_12]HCY76109.1 hypothetical protein [Ignavibacteriales bacterium]